MKKDKELEDIGTINWIDAQKAGINPYVYNLSPEVLSDSYVVPVSNPRKGVEGKILFDRNYAYAKFIQLLDQLELTNPKEINSFLEEVASIRIKDLEVTRESAKEEIKKLIEEKLRKSGLSLADLDLNGKQ